MNEPEDVKPTDVSAAESKASPSITFKAVFLAVMAVVVINAFAGFGDDELKQGLIIGNHMPVAVYFTLFGLVCLWNPLMSISLKFLVLGRRETAVFFVLVLVGCWAPTSGLYRYFNRVVVGPVYNEVANPTWTKYGLVNMLPEKLFPLKGDMNAPASDRPDRPEGVIPASGDSVYSGFVQGLNITSDSISGSLHQMSEVMGAWAEPMQYWGVLLFFMALTVLSLSLILHRQWSKHEQLAYPLAGIAQSVMEREEGKIFGKVFRSKLFWGGFVLPFTVHMINWGHGWFSSEIPSITLKWWLPWEKIFPVINDSGDFGVRQGTIFFCIIGVCYFAASEVSLTIGLSTLILTIFGAQYYLAEGKPLSRESIDMVKLGGGFAYGVMLFWAGRSYYIKVFAKALTFRRANESEVDGVWAARVFIISFFAMIYTLSIMGFDWFIAFLFSASYLLMMTILTRVVCEAGTPFIQPWGSQLPLGVGLPKLFGPAVFGAKPLVFFNYMSQAIFSDPRECMMPYVSNGLKVSEAFKLKLKRLCVIIMGVVIVGMVVGFVARSYSSYKFGAQKDGWAWNKVSNTAIDSSVKGVAFLHETGQLEASESASGLGRLAFFDPDPEVVKYMGIGVVLMFSMFFMRFRFSWFPLHPLLIVVLGTYAFRSTWASYLIGWLIKSLVVRFGGGRVYQDLKPLFIGLIVGELVVGGLAIVTGFIYFGTTGLKPPWFGILPY